MASACLPFLFQAVEVDGEHYWDGGFMGNPPIYPLIYHTDCEDVLIVQINPIVIADVPRTAQEIADRMNELSFNGSLMREMRTIHFVTKLLDEQRVEHGRYKRLKIHTIEGEREMAELGYSSKLNADRTFWIGCSSWAAVRPSASSPPTATTSASLLDRHRREVPLTDLCERRSWADEMGLRVGKRALRA